MPQFYNTHFLVQHFQTVNDVKHVLEQALQTFPWHTAAWCEHKHKYVIHVLDENHDDLALKIHILPACENNQWWINVSIARRSPHVAMYWRVFLHFYNHIGSFFIEHILTDTHSEYAPRYTYERHIVPSTDSSPRVSATLIELDSRTITNNFFPMLFCSLRTYALLQLARAHISQSTADEAGVYPVAQSCVWSGTVSWVHLYALWKLAPEKDKERALRDLNDASSILCASCKDKGFTVKSNSANIHFDNAICIACFSLVTL